MIRSCFTIILFLLLLACSPLGHYRNLPEVKGWEGDILKFQQLDNIEHYQADAIMFAGSSSIRLWSTLAEDMAPYSVIQRGYGGAKFSDFAVYADRIFDSHPCKGLVLFIANDITGDEEDKKPEEVKRLFLKKVGVLMVFASQQPGRQGGIRSDGNAQLSSSLQGAVAFNLAVQQAVAHLVGCQR